MNFRLGTISLFVAWSALAGCVTRPTPPSLAQIQAIRTRTEAQFARALFLKPAPSATATAQARQLAPLLIIEAPGPNALPDWPGPNAHPQIFFRSGSATLNGRRHEQLTYWWTYPKGPGRAASRAQGTRITLNSAGQPVIWEVLADSSGASLVFVAQSLEAQVVREVGPALEQRRFAVERSLRDAPNVVVARVIDDGPMPMGPIIYLRSDTHDVTTVSCRCMEAQAHALAGQLEYELVMPRDYRSHSLGTLQEMLRLPNSF